MFHLHSSEGSTMIGAVLVCLVLLYDSMQSYLSGARPTLSTVWGLFWFVVSCAMGLRYLASGRRHAPGEWVVADASHPRIAVITGGTSGIGLEVAKGLLAVNYTVVLVGRNTAKLADAKKVLLQSVKRERHKPVGVAQGRKESAGPVTACTPSSLASETEEEHAATSQRTARVITLDGFDLANFASVRETVRCIKRMGLHVSLLVNCAATLERHKTFSMNQRGGVLAAKRHETTIATNFLGTMLFTQLMIPIMEETSLLGGPLSPAKSKMRRSNNDNDTYTFPSSDDDVSLGERTTPYYVKALRADAVVPSRIVNVASCCHSYLGLFEHRSPMVILQALHESAPGHTKLPTEDDFTITSFVGVYGLSKLCVVYYTQWLFEKLLRRQRAFSPDTHAPLIDVCCCHPGIICTGLYRQLVPTWAREGVLYFLSLVLFKTNTEGAETVLDCCLARDKAYPQLGLYYVDSREASGSWCAERQAVNYNAASAAASPMSSLSRWATDAKERDSVVAWGMSQIVDDLTAGNK